MNYAREAACASGGKLFAAAALAVLFTQQLKHVICQSEPISQRLAPDAQQRRRHDGSDLSGSSSVARSGSSSATSGTSVDTACKWAGGRTFGDATAKLCGMITSFVASANRSSLDWICSASGGGTAAGCSTPVGAGNESSGGSSSDGDRAPGTTIPLSYFGLTVNHDKSVPFPSLPFGAIRSWDATDVSWDNINIAANTYNWSGLDAWMRYVSGHNVDILYTFGRTPKWASSKPSAHTGFGPGQCAPPVNLSDWDKFVRAIVNHAAGRIKYWELWNEPQERAMYCGTIPQMVTMAQHAYNIIKAADPASRVITPATLYDNGAGPAWLDAYLAGGGANYADAVSFHGYLNAPVEEHLAVISRYQAVARKYNLESKPLWNTESDWGKTKGAADQAAYLAKYYLIQWGAGLSRFYWYAYDNARYGTLYTDGTLNQQGTAFAQVSNWMVGATQTQRCAEDSSSTWTCRFARDGGYEAMAIWNATGNVTYTPAPQYHLYRDLTGASHAISGSITVGNRPILLEPGLR